MNPHRASFVSGIVLGMTVGLVLGHVTMRQSQQNSGPAVISSQSFSVDPDSAWEIELGESSAALSETDHVFPEDESRHDVPDVEPLRSSPLQNAIAIRTSEERISGASPLPLSAKSEPEPLPIPAAGAAPLPGGPSDEAIRALINSELSELSPQQREIWYEALRDVAHQDVAGILRMWKTLGAPITPGLLGRQPSPDPTLQLPLEEPLFENPTVADRRRTVVIDDAIGIRRRNLEMGNNIGCVRLVPELIQELTEQGPEVTGVDIQLDFVTLRTQTTGFPLDLAIDGPGLFVVSDGQGQRYFTRKGRFCLDANRRIVLLEGVREMVLQPEIHVPAEVRVILIHEDGQVSFDADKTRAARLQIALPLSPVRLRDAGNALLRVATEHSADVLLSVPGENGAGLIRQGALEFPNFDMAAERQAIDDLKQLKLEH